MSNSISCLLLLCIITRCYMELWYISIFDPDLYWTPFLLTKNTIFALSIQTPSRFTIFILKVEAYFTNCPKIAGWVLNSVATDHSAMFDLGLNYCLFRLICSNTQAKQSIYVIIYEQHPNSLISVLYVCMYVCMYVCVAVLRPSQPNGVMSSAVSLPNHTFTGQA